MMNEAQVKLLERVKKNLRPTLISQKGGVTLDRLNRDYSELMGEGIPFRNLQFQTMEAFLQSIPDVCSLDWNRGELVVCGVADENTEHIVKMVGLQKTKTKKRKKGGFALRPVQRVSATRGRDSRDFDRKSGGSIGQFESSGGSGNNLNGPHRNAGQSHNSCNRGGYSGHQGKSSGLVPWRGIRRFQETQVARSRSTNVGTVDDGFKKLTISQNVLKQTEGEAVYGKRVTELLEGRVFGLFSSQVEKMYEKKWEEVLPIDWWQNLSNADLVTVEVVNGQRVVYISTKIPVVVSPSNITRYPSIISPQIPSWSNPPPSMRSRNNSPGIFPYLNQSKHPQPLACSSLANMQGFNHEYSQPPPDFLSPSTSHSSMKLDSSPSQSSLPRLAFPDSSNWDISVCMVTSSNQIYFQLNDNMEKLDELVTAMDDFYASSRLPLPKGDTSIGSILCASVDGGFYRVEFLDQTDFPSCHCLFLDIGLENHVDIGDLQELPRQFMQLPAQAVPACLAKVEHWVEDEVVEYATKLLDGESFIALVDNREELGDWYLDYQVIPFMFLMDSSYTNMAAEINKFIVKLSSSFLIGDTNNNKDQCQISSSDSCLRVTFGPEGRTISNSVVQYPDGNSSISESQPSIILPTPEKSPQDNSGPLPLPSLPVPGDLHDLTVTKASSPDLFQTVSYIQKGSYSCSLSQMTKFYSDSNNLSSISSDQLTTGSVLAYMDITTSSWHRAMIVRVVSLHPLALALKLVDQGCFKACTDPGLLQPLKFLFRKLPPQACGARLAGVEPGVGGWGNELLKWFREVTMGKDFVGRVVEVMNSESLEAVLVLELIDTSNPSVDINVNKKLIDLQLVVAAKAMQLKS